MWNVLAVPVILNPIIATKQWTINYYILYTINTLYKWMFTWHIKQSALFCPQHHCPLDLTHKHTAAQQQESTRDIRSSIHDADEPVKLKCSMLRSVSFNRARTQHLKLCSVLKPSPWVATRSLRDTMQPSTTHRRQTFRTHSWLCLRLERTPTGRCASTPLWMRAPRQR